MDQDSCLAIFGESARGEELTKLHVSGFHVLLQQIAEGHIVLIITRKDGSLNNIDGDETTRAGLLYKKIKTMSLPK